MWVRPYLSRADTPTHQLLSSLVCLSRLGHPILHLHRRDLTLEKPEVQRGHLLGLKPCKCKGSTRSHQDQACDPTHSTDTHHECLGLPLPAGGRKWAQEPEAGEKGLGGLDWEPSPPDSEPPHVLGASPPNSKLPGWVIASTQGSGAKCSLAGLDDPTCRHYPTADKDRRAEFSVRAEGNLGHPGSGASPLLDLKPLYSED